MPWGYFGGRFWRWEFCCLQASHETYSWSVGWAGRFFVTLIGMLFYEQNYGLDSYWYFEIRSEGSTRSILAWI